MFQPSKGRIGTLTSAIRRLSTSAQIIDPLQEQALGEKCIVVDESDRNLGYASKLDCHKVRQDGSMILHRAFSVFLFTPAGQIVVQRRSASKVTFPNHVSNTCCSHPIEDFPDELVEENASGIKMAARRRLNYELGIPTEQINLKDLKYLTRILYKGVSDDGIWGEHEMDYILFMQKDVTIKPNPTEIGQIDVVDRDKFGDYLTSLKYPITPWFKLIVQSQLPIWWDNLSNLRKFQDHKNIQRFY